ncbi:hypothetical protein M3665_26290, partial [Bacillus licheniformis]|nr:hypothetical protein [Bacillus licheniformis]
CLIGAKVANLGVPVVMKRIVDHLSYVQQLTALGRAEQSAGIVLAGGVGLLVVAYALVRLSTSLFTELREILFSKVTESAVRQLAAKLGNHWRVVDPGTARLGRDAIAVALLYDSRTVEPVGRAATLAIDDKNRQPLAQSFRLINGNKQALTV